MKPTKVIRKELAMLIKEKHKTCTTDKEKRIAVEAARQDINKKYGSGWRNQWADYGPTEGAPDQYTDHVNGQHWMD